jgi:hypothetical protein
MGFKLSMAVLVAASAPRICAASDAPSTATPASSATTSTASGPVSSAGALAEQRYREGTGSLERGDFEAARLAFVQAYALDSQPRYLYDLAVAEAKGTHPIEALAHLRQYLTLPGITEADRSAASLLMAEAASKTGQIRVEQSAPEAAAQGAGVQGPSAAAASSGEELTPNGKPLPTTKWIVAAGLVAGGLVTFGIAGAVAAAGSNESSKEADLSLQTGVCLQPPMTSACTALKNAADARATDGDVAIGFASAGGALVVAGLLALIAWPAAKSPQTTGFFAPFVTSRSAGAQWAQQF